MILFFDTETTGKADFRAAPDAPHQPRLVQFAGLLTDDEGKEVSHVRLTVRPEGFEIPEEASGIHGITTAIARAIGVDCGAVRNIFRAWWQCSSMVVGHNVEFDLFIMDGEFARASGAKKAWGDPRATFCTMRRMTPVCKLPGKYGDFKWPKLQEAYKHAFGSDFEGAHDAMADVRACAKIYFWLQNQPKSHEDP